MHEMEQSRAELGVATQVGFAALLGISPQQYRKIISGRSGVSETIIRLVDAYRAGYRPLDWEVHTSDRRRAS